MRSPPPNGRERSHLQESVLYCLIRQSGPTEHCGHGKSEQSGAECKIHIQFIRNFCTDDMLQ